jgi:hypothetical protein
MMAKALVPSSSTWGIEISRILLAIPNYQLGGLRILGGLTWLLIQEPHNDEVSSTTAGNGTTLIVNSANKALQEVVHSDWNKEA